MGAVAARDFSKATVRGLKARGVAFIGTVALPGPGPMPWANADRGYQVSDNGTGRVWTHAQVLAQAVR